MTRGLKQTCLPDIHGNTFEGPHWNLCPYGPNTAHTGTAVDIYVLTVLSYLERRGVARTGRNLGPDGILDWTESRLCKIIMGPSTACQLCQPPAICTHSRYPQRMLCLLPIRLQSASQNSSRSNCSILFHEASSSQSLLCVLALITLMYDDSMLHMCQ